ncbi:hypothetical protein FRB99_000645 [Tulasnella sp. 403]|nr:hypothetical protein FRB99_000645 [Tulasnella sp. 403]
MRPTAFFVAILAASASVTAAPLPSAPRAIVAHESVIKPNTIVHKAGVLPVVKRDCAMHADGPPTPVQEDLYTGNDQQVMLKGPVFDPEPNPHRVVFVFHGMPPLRALKPISDFLHVKLAIPSFKIAFPFPEFSSPFHFGGPLNAIRAGIRTVIKAL